jgi:hypothetical protein
MTKYLFLYWNPPSPDRPMSPADMQAIYAQWNAWKDKFKSQILDLGDALKGGGKILKAGQVTDGPHMEAKEIIGGYSIVQAESYEHALTVARECPVTLMPGGSIEIRELAGF